MKKNSKGFTMVEIIAVVAILGILIMVTMPRLLSLVTSSKDEIYVQDAKKLIAQARYVMGKNSNEIEKPMAGNYIVLSLNYLGSTNFSSPPNGGSYLTEASFVVVKNVQKPDSDIEDFKYSAVLIESAKEGFYRGIKMSSEEELNTNSAKTLVTYFNDDDIVYIDEDAAINNSCEEERCTLSEEYINTYATDENMKSEEGTIVGKYNNIITKQDGEEVEVFSAPTFTARAISDSGSLYALGGNLYVVARDADNEVSDLKVCVKISKDSNDSYPDVNDSTYCKPYGSEESLDNGTYKLAFDLSNYDFSYDEREVAYFYIIVSDPEGNYSRKKIDYEVHKNTAPVINLFEIAKHKDESRNFNMPFVSLRGSFVDDMDDISKLKFCLVDSNKGNDNRECTDYHDYNYYFNGNNKYYFKNEDGSNITKPDGSTHYLTLYVKDSNNLVTSQKATLGSNINKVDENDNHTYKIYKNQNPVITSFKLDSDMIKKDGYESGHDIKNVSVDITVDDDMTKVADLKLVIGKNGEISFSTYDSSSSPFKKYTFDGGYDGKDRSLTITVTDEFGATATATQVLKNIYKDQAPQVSFEVSSENIYRSRIFDKNGDEKIPIVPKPKDCINGTEGVCFKTTDYFCSSCKPNIVNGIVENGSYNVTIRSSIVDDLTTTSNLRACITTDKNGCSKDEDFKDKSASSFINFSYEILGSYDLAYKENKTVTIYLYVKDGTNPAVKAEKKYKLYKNVAPKVKVAEDNVVTAGKGGLNTGNVYVKNLLTITDDFNDYKVDFCYLVKDKNYDEKKIPAENEILKGNCTEVNREIIDKGTMPFEFKDDKGVVLDYDSQRVYTMYKITDGYGETANSNVILYKLSANVPPEIVDFTVESSAEKKEDGKTPKYNSIVFDYSFTVYDPEDNFTACITTLVDPDRCDYTTPEGRANFKGMDDNGTPYVGGSDRIIKGQYKVEKFNSYEKQLIWAPNIEEDGNVIVGKWKYSTNVDELFQQYYYSKGIIETESDHKSETLLFVVADSKGAIAKKEYAYVPRYSCSLHYDSNEIKNYLANKDIDDDDSLTPEEKEEAKKQNPTNIDVKSISDYESIDSTTAYNFGYTDDINSVADEISPEYCNGLCYEDVNDNHKMKLDGNDNDWLDIDYYSNSFPAKNNVRAFYEMTITYEDKLVQDDIKNNKLLASDLCPGKLPSKFSCARASCLDDTKRDGNKNRDNNYLISLHLYDRNVTWTSKVKGLSINRSPYSSYCQVPELKKKLLFNSDDYRIGKNVDTLCNEQQFKRLCENSYEKGFDSSLPSKVDSVETYCNDSRVRPQTEFLECNSILDENSCANKVDNEINDIIKQCNNSSIEKKPIYCSLVDNEKVEYRKNAINECENTLKETYCTNKANEDINNIQNICDANDSETPKPAYCKFNEKQKEEYKEEEINSCINNFEQEKSACRTKIENEKDRYDKDYKVCEKEHDDLENAVKENNEKKEEYNKKVKECTLNKKNSCNKELLGYSNNIYPSMLDDSSCNSPSKVSYCDSSVLDGKCYNSNCDYNSNDESTCKKVCYKEISCDYNPNNTNNFQINSLCHGYFKLYRSKKVGNKVVVEDTGMRVCPDLVSSRDYGGHFSYSPDSDVRYIKFFPSDYGGVINE